MWKRLKVKCKIVLYLINMKSLHYIHCKFCPKQPILVCIVASSMTSSPLAKVGADERHAALVEAVVFAGSLSLGLEVEGEEELGASRVQVHWQVHLAVWRLLLVQSGMGEYRTHVVLSCTRQTHVLTCINISENWNFY